MWQILLLFTAVIVIMILLMQLAMRWVSGLVTRDLRANLHAAEAIIERAEVPEAWLLSYRKRIAAMRQAGKSERQIERLGKAAHKHCLRQFDEVIYFFEKANVTDTPATRKVLLDGLRAQRNRWAAAPWQTLFETAQPLGQPDAGKQPATGLD